MNNTIKILSSVTTLEWSDFVSQIATAEGVFTADECKTIIAMANELPTDSGVVETRSDEGEIKYTATSARDSTVRFLVPNPATMWIFDKLDACLNHVNQAYKSQLVGFYEGAQLASYASQQYYDWHTDLGQGKTSTRKLSISIQLSSSDDYDGGDLEFMCAEGSVPREIGSVVVFPSYLTHRVVPVTRGARWSMVSWIHGRPFR